MSFTILCNRFSLSVLHSPVSLSSLSSDNSDEKHQLVENKSLWKSISCSKATSSLSDERLLSSDFSGFASYLLSSELMFFLSNGAGFTEAQPEIFQGRGGFMESRHFDKSFF